MKSKTFYKLGVLWAFLLIFSCQKTQENFSAIPSDGIFIAPSKSGRPIEEVKLILSSLPSIIDFSVALYKEASSDVKVSLAIDLASVETYNLNNNTSYQALPLESVSISEDTPIIKQSSRVSDTLRLVLNSSQLEEGVSYLLPVKMSNVSGGNIILNELTSTKYYIITGQLPNIALSKNTLQSTTNGSAESGRAVDGNVNGAWSGGSVTHTAEGLPEQWWEVDLGGNASRISEIKIYNRSDCCSERLSNYYVFVSEKPFASTSVTETLEQEGVTAYFESAPAGSPSRININKGGRYVRIQLTQGTMPLAIAEVEILGVL